MSRLYVLYDFSPSRPWLFATVHANRALLEARGIDLGPLHPWSCELVPSHLSFWRVIPENDAIPAYFANMLDELAGRLASGRNVLLLSRTPDILSHQSFERLWRRHAALAQHDVQIFFIVGRPACMLEQGYREARSLLPEKNGLAHVRRYGSLPILIRDAQQKWGKENVSLLANTSASPVSLPQANVARSLFDFLNCPEPLPLRHAPRHPLCLASNAARRLSWTLEVRENAWPDVDEGLFMESLLALDRQWATAPVSPKNIRDALIRNGTDALRELEEMLALQSGALDCPDWLAEQPEADMDAPLSDDILRSFAVALPPEVREPLRQRFANDAPLLTADQKALSRALASITADGSENGMVIGEPVPPVELTVLTMTYNHEKYIAECMDSVLAQQTSFPVRHVVLDHHSTDGTAEIVAAYAAQHPSIQPVLLSRRRPAENVMGLFSRCRTRYAALCDGDDYFTDPLKLQKQIDFLESHSRCALCFHPVALVLADGREAGVFPSHETLPRGIREEYYLSDLLKGNMIQTNSVVYRWRFQEGMPEWFRADLGPGDLYWHLLHAETGRIGFLPEVMSVYRRHGSALYKDAFVSPLEHRRAHGMAELRTYWAINEHFHNRYFRSLSMLANNIFANFLYLKLETGEEGRSLLDQASKAFPEFASGFFSSLKIIKAPSDREAEG